MKQKTLFVSAAVLLLLVFTAATMIYKNQKANEAVQSAQQNGDLLLRAHAPSLGNADAPVTIVEFFDPACETCAQFYPLVKKLMADNPEKIRLVLRYAPFHPGADKVVAVLEAARKQGKYWLVLETLLATQPEWTVNHEARVELVWKPLERVALNLEQMQYDMTSPDIAALIAQDMADVRELKIRQTPEYFVNRTPLVTFGYSELKQLVDNALTAAARI
jgi:protein-disulfide isomerase